MKTFITVLANNKKQKILLWSAVTLIVLGFFIYRKLPTQSVWQEILIASIVSITISWLDVFLVAFVQYRKFKDFEGNYHGYRYQSDKTEDIGKPEWNTREKDPQSTAKITYIFGNEFRIELSHPLEDPDYQWQGIMKMTSENMADISWQYICPLNLKDSVGYKRAVIIKEEDRVSTIYMFSPDQQRFGREILIKIKK